MLHPPLRAALNRVTTQPQPQPPPPRGTLPQHPISSSSIQHLRLHLAWSPPASTPTWSLSSSRGRRRRGLLQRLGPPPLSKGLQCLRGVLLQGQGRRTPPQGMAGAAGAPGQVLLIPQETQHAEGLKGGPAAKPAPSPSVSPGMDASSLDHTRKQVSDVSIHRVETSGGIGAYDSPDGRASISPASQACSAGGRPPGTAPAGPTPAPVPCGGWEGVCPVFLHLDWERQQHQHHRGQQREHQHRVFGG